MKAILVIDIPYIDKKQINYLSVSFGGIPYYIGRDAMMLRPLPEKNTWDVTENGHVTEFAEGWNTCLEELEE